MQAPSGWQPSELLQACALGHATYRQTKVQRGTTDYCSPERPRAEMTAPTAAIIPKVARMLAATNSADCVRAAMICTISMCSHNRVRYDRRCRLAALP